MIAVVVPTIRKKQYRSFLEAWDRQFKEWGVTLITVWDGDTPRLTVNGKAVKYPKELMKLVFNKNDGVRNLGFWYIAKHLPNIEYILTLDDDVAPLHDTIGEHLEALQKSYPVSWFSHTSEYVRGFPYGVREEAEAVLSHGIWEGVKDWDAPTQLVTGNEARNLDFYIGAIPKGANYTMCGMNIAFKRKLLPYMYFAPMGHRVGIDRFADIWLGIESKKIIDAKGWAVVTGYASVYHTRASNVWKNLQKEARGLEMNEFYGKDNYFKLYKQKRLEWQKLLQKYLS